MASQYHIGAFFCLFSEMFCLRCLSRKFIFTVALEWVNYLHSFQHYLAVIKRVFTNLNRGKTILNINGSDGIDLLEISIANNLLVDLRKLIQAVV